MGGSGKAHYVDAALVAIYRGEIRRKIATSARGLRSGFGAARRGNDGKRNGLGAAWRVNDGERIVVGAASRGNDGTRRVLGAARRGNDGKRNIFELPASKKHPKI